tara:strand:+ start:2805 stop:3815 length:1011 start_codon:yes stop_codon:yes gene_type:complete
MAFKMKGFKPHNMYKTERAETHKEHLSLKEKGYDHNPYKKKSPLKDHDDDLNVEIDGVGRPTASDTRKYREMFPNSSKLSDRFPEVTNEEYYRNKYGDESGDQKKERAMNAKMEYANDMQNFGLGEWVKGKSPIHWLRMQKKWGKFAHGFGGYSGGRQIPSDASPEQRMQKSIGDELFLRASKMVQHPQYVSGFAAQGVAFEKVYNSPQFQKYIKKNLDELTRKGYDASKVQTDLWKGYDYPLGKSNYKGELITGDNLTKDGISKQREQWIEGKGFRGPTQEEMERYERKHGLFHPGDPNKTDKEVSSYLGFKRISKKDKDKVQRWLDSEEGEDLT